VADDAIEPADLAAPAELDEAPGPLRNPFAVPYAALVADAELMTRQFVVEVPHRPPPDTPSGVDVPADAGDGD
jgi:hypothetical protein